MTELLNPHFFKVTVHKVRPMYRPKFYLAAVKIQDRVRLLRCNTRFKTFTAAYVHADQVYQRWCRLYASAVSAQQLAMSEPVPAEA